MVASLRALPTGPLGPAQLLVPKFLLEAEGNLQTYWIPFERLNPTARVAIVGLTPGWQQMTEAFAAARDALTAGMTDERLIMDYIEQQAGFVGSMRTNMVRMLDAIGMSDALGLQSCAELFADQEGLVHGTSALRYPVFVRGENYGGQGPSVQRSPMLTRYVRQQLAPELAAVPDALVLPLGKAVEGCLRMLVADGQLDEVRCLFGFPHPSGGNGHRVAQFGRNHVMLHTQIAEWATASR
jgi:hypothetical protein